MGRGTALTLAMNVLAYPRAPFPQTADAAPLATIEIRASVAVMSLDLPCPTRWTPTQQQIFRRALSDLGERSDVTAIVIHGADVFGEAAGAEAPNFRTVIDAISGCGLPVCAAIPGDAVGGGLELALACSWRVARPGAQLSLPDLDAGRLPTHGAVERLPRLVGLTPAADLLVFGEVIGGAAALKIGLVDALADTDVVAAAVDLALANADEARRRPEASVEMAEAFGLRLRVRREAPDQAAPLIALQAMEAAARLPVRRAMAETLKAAQALAASDQARALAYASVGRGVLERWGSPAARQILARRLRWPLLREAVHLLDEGATPSQVDRLLVAFGFREGPFTLSDRLGLDNLFGVAPDGAVPADPWLCYSPTLDLMADAGRLGGALPGWYRRAQDEAAHLTFDPEVAKIIQASATFQRLSRHPITDEGLAERCLLAAINGAAELLQTEDNLSVALLDAIWTETLGFPRWKGGPLYMANRMGLDRVAEDLRKLQARRNTVGPLSEIIERSAARGEGLA